MDSQAVLMPGGLRWRTLVAVENQEGVCEAVYDLERNSLVDVPEQFEYYIAMALDSGSPDEALLGWLASEDLLTCDRDPDERTSGGGLDGSSAMADLSELSLACGCVYFVEDRAHCRLSDGEQASLETLDCLLSPVSGVTHLTVHLDGEGGRLSFDRLRRIVDATGARAERSGREISYELRLDADSVTDAVASFLGRHPFRVRVRCDGPPQPETTIRGLQRLRAHLGEKLTVHSVLRDSGLLPLWKWAKELGLEHLHVTRLAGRSEAVSKESQVRAFRSDLVEICDDMFDALQSGDRKPLLYEPIMRVIRRLARDNPPTSGSETPCVGVVSRGKVLPVFQGSSPFPGPLSATPPDSGAEAAAGSDGEKTDGCGFPCHTCTARRLCGRGLAADPALSGIERLDIWGRHCDFWRAEVERGLLFYRRLREIDPEFLLGLAGGSSDAFLDPLDTAADYVEWKTC
jgi:hypothetical protein